MSKTHKSSHSQDHEAQPSAVAFANVVSDIFEACFAQYKETKKQTWIESQKQAGNTIFVMDDGTLVAAEIKSTYKS